MADHPGVVDGADEPNTTLRGSSGYIAEPRAAAALVVELVRAPGAPASGPWARWSSSETVHS